MTEEQARKLMEEFAALLATVFERGAAQMREAMVPDAVNDAQESDMREDIRNIRETVEDLAQQIRDGALNG